MMATLTQAVPQHKDIKYCKELSEKQNPHPSISINKAFERNWEKKSAYIFKTNPKECEGKAEKVT